MQTLKRFIQCLFHSFLKVLFGLMVAAHARRLSFIVSLHCQLREREAINWELLEKLNQALHLADRDSRALLLPTRMCSFFWDEQELSDVMEYLMSSSVQSPEGRYWVADQVTKRAPKCLRYGRHEDMRKDVERLLEYHIAKDALPV